MGRDPSYRSSDVLFIGTQWEYEKLEVFINYVFVVMTILFSIK